MESKRTILWMETSDIVVLKIISVLVLFNLELIIYVSVLVLK